MKILMTARFPNEPFNTLVRKGKVDEIMGEILEAQKPEVVYFTEIGGERGCICVIDINNQSQIPQYAEPYFLNFNAKCRFSIAMTPQDLKVAGLKEIGKKWDRVEARM
jgi:hypothetical protein